MTIYEFQALDEMEKYSALDNQGKLIEQYETNGYLIALYAVSDFFVELFYKQGSSKLIKIRPFKTRKLLSKYLKNINLDELS